MGSRQSPTGKHCFLTIFTVYRKRAAGSFAGGSFLWIILKITP